MSGESLTEVRLLNGKVRKWTLPVFQGPPQPGVSGIKRLFLQQGELAQFYDADEGMRYMAFVELLFNQLRGNHFHQRKQEWIYLISGESALLLADTGSQERASVELKAGDLAFIPPGVAHALRTVHPGHAVEFSPIRFDPKDVHPYRLD